ncbi:hypothetical protein QCA50_007382 [Cerrena zonata]|uniref:Uncharacterized protein n=1 Tax=Cerrena zonata TaxID=2478898 RepID=A0AAW0GKG9_9APHY
MDMSARWLILTISGVTMGILLVPLSFWSTLGTRFCGGCLKNRWAIPTLDSVTLHIVRRSPSFTLTSDAWNYMLPSGGHIIHEGHSDGTVSVHTVAVFHQLRCLNIIRRYKLDGNHTEAISHCFNYLRESLICGIDMYLEEIPTRPVAAGYDRKCNDWEAVWREAEKNHASYDTYIRE